MEGFAHSVAPGWLVVGLGCGPLGSSVGLSPALSTPREGRAGPPVGTRGPAARPHSTKDARLSEGARRVSQPPATAAQAAWAPAPAQDLAREAPACLWGLRRPGA